MVLTSPLPTKQEHIPPLQLQRHIRYFSHCLRSLPGVYTALDNNRLTLVHFAVQSLDILGALDDDNDDENSEYSRAVLDRNAVIEWIYSLYTPGDADTGVGAGFKGGTFLGAPHLATGDICGSCVGGWDNNFEKYESGPGPGPRSGPRPLNVEYDCGHVAMTYTALCTLAALGDDFERLDKEGVIRGLKGLQNEDGSFQSTVSGSERDMRFLYCACAISHMLNDWSGVDVDLAVHYVLRCRTYDGAIGLMPGQEGHGGSTFCGIASLYLTGRIQTTFESDPSWMPSLMRWCVSRQVSGEDYDGGTGGMQGRPNKAEDTCYSYWVGGTLRLLSEAEHEAGTYDSLLDRQKLTSYVLRNQTPMGGFSKLVGANPDVLHSFYSVAWLSLAFFSGADDFIEDGGASLRQMDCALGMRDYRTNIFRKMFGGAP